jgi:hypothetical protein
VNLELVNMNDFGKNKWQKWKRPKKANRPFKKRPDSINFLVGGALKRHGIGPQVQAAMIVKRANEVLDRIIEERFRSDVRVISFQRTELHVACRHAPARHVIDSVRVQISEEMTVHFPSITINRIFCKVDPHMLDSKSEIS